MISRTAAFAVTGFGNQSVFDPASESAQRILTLAYWMFGAAAIIWIAMVVLAAYSVKKPYSRFATLIIGGGVVFPAIVLGVLLTYSLPMLPKMLARPPEGSLRITVTGEQWWWRVRYEPAGRDPVELANEIHLPAGEPVEFRLGSADVIHSFWIPPLGGKVDMIPGRTTRLTAVPNKAGTYRGACAEYCGTSHALMSLYLVVEDKQTFERWLTAQAEPVRSAADHGQFLSAGCGACHAIRGTSANGRIGPDLTHVGSRLSVGAGILRNHHEELSRWISHPAHVKPGVLMPRFSMLGQRRIREIAKYLDGLE